jgi:hypothetical protein
MSFLPYDPSISDAQADALFASALQRSDAPSRWQVRQAIATAIGLYGQLGCTARVAQAYGEHPETAVIRMRWARTAIADTFGGSQPQPVHADRLPAGRTPRPRAHRRPRQGGRAACARIPGSAEALTRQPSQQVLAGQDKRNCEIATATPARRP